MGYAIAGIIVIIAGVLAWLSLTSWRWANIVLAFLIVCAASTFLFLAAYTLKVHSAWRSKVNEGIAKIEAEEAQQQEKLQGVSDETGKLRGGIQELTREVQRLVVKRGQAWFDVKPEAVGPDGSMEVSIEAPEPHGMPAQSIVYLFEALPVSQGGEYLGEFRVIEAAAGSKIVKLQPNMPLTAAEIERVKQPKGLLNIYLKMPIDENDVYVALSDEQAGALLPKDLDESFRKGTRSEADMTDWVYMFHEHALQRDLINDEMSKLQSNTKRLEESLVRTEEKIQYRTQEKADLAFDLNGFSTERDAVTAYAGTLDKRAKKFAGEVASVRSQNAKLAAQLKALQLKAAEEINRRTETARAQ